LSIEATRVLRRLRQIRRIFRASHSEVGKVVQETTEYFIAVFGVFERVQDMPVPKFIHVLAWGQGYLGVSYQQSQETPVRQFHAVNILARPALAFLGIHQLELDRIEIESLYRSDHSFNGSVRQLHFHCSLCLGL